MVFEPDLMPHAEAYYGWKEANVARVVACERRCISHDHRYAGTADCLVELKTGELALLDYKSSKAGPWDGRKLEHALQLAAYRLALAEEGLIVRHRLILQLPSNEPGRLIVHEYEHHKADTLAFLACLAIYRYVEQHWGGQP